MSGKLSVSTSYTPQHRHLVAIQTAADAAASCKLFMSAVLFDILIVMTTC
jgi:hypothetical protein